MALNLDIASMMNKVSNLLKQEDDIYSTFFIIHLLMKPYMILR